MVFDNLWLSDSIPFQSWCMTIFGWCARCAKRRQHGRDVRSRVCLKIGYATKKWQFDEGNWWSTLPLDFGGFWGKPFPFPKLCILELWKSHSANFCGQCEAASFRFFDVRRKSFRFEGMGCCRLWGEGIWVYLGLCQDYWADNAMIYLGKYHIMKCFVWENQLENQVSSLQIVLYFLPRSLRFTFFFCKSWNCCVRSGPRIVFPLGNVPRTDGLLLA